VTKLLQIQEGTGQGLGGTFTISTPVVLNNGTGHFLICAYSGYGASNQDDVAWASTAVTVRRGPSAGGKPAGREPADGHYPYFSGSVLHVKASGPLTAGSVLTITGTGTNASRPGFPYEFDVFLVAPVLGPCKTSFNAEQAVFFDNPAGYVSRLLQIQEGTGPRSGGPFKISTPVVLNKATGHLLICAYSGYGANPQDDVAWASTEVTIQGR
jgi:hypothetical protein